MSEMKPVAWLYEVKVLETNSWINGATAYEPIAETDRRRNVQPLYTADQLAEAVATERERCAKLCEASASQISNEDWSTAHDAFGAAGIAAEEAALGCAEAIRSAAK